MISVALYLRVSTEDQKQHSTIDRQRGLLAGWLANHPGYSITREYADEAISGTLPIEDRPQGRHLLNDARNGLFESVLCSSLDRIGRRLLVITGAYQALTDAGVDVIIIDSPWGIIDTKNPMQKFAFHLMGAVAEFERDIIYERTQTMKKRRAEEGRWPGGSVPYGYDLSDGKLIINPQEARIVKELFYRIVSGESFEALARDLQARGIKAPKKQQGQVVEEVEWYASRINKMFKPPLYTGEHITGTIHQQVPAIIDRKMWEDYHAKKVRRGSKQVKDAGLLSGIFRCSLCGGTYYSTLSSGRRCYMCSSYRVTDLPRTSIKASTPAHCRSKIIPEAELDTLIIDKVEEYLSQPERWARVLLESDSQREGALAELYTEEQRLQTEYRVEEQALVNLVQQLTHGDLRQSVYEVARQQQEAVLATIEHDLDQIRRRLRDEEGAQANEHEIFTLVAQARERWEAMVLPERREFLRRIITSAWLTTIDVKPGEVADKRIKHRVEVSVNFAFREVAEDSVPDENTCRRCTDNDSIYGASTSLVTTFPS